MKPVAALGRFNLSQRTRRGSRAAAHEFGTDSNAVLVSFAMYLPMTAEEEGTKR